MAGNYKKELPGPTELTTPAQKQGRQYLADELKNKKVTPYGGRLSADRPEYEGNIPGLVDTYAGRGASPLIQSAQDQLRKTIEGEYDPRTSPYYASYRDEAMRNFGDLQTAIKQSAQMGGGLKSSGRVKQEFRAGRDVGMDLNSVLGGLYEAERGRQLGAIPQAQALTEYTEGAPLRTLQAIMGAGGYQSSVEQADLDRMYQEFQRQQAEEKVPLGIAEFLASPSNYAYYQKEYEPYTTTRQKAARYLDPGGGFMGMYGENEQKKNPLGSILS